MFEKRGFCEVLRSKRNPLILWRDDGRNARMMGGGGGYGHRRHHGMGGGGFDMHRPRSATPPPVYGPQLPGGASKWTNSPYAASQKHSDLTRFAFADDMMIEHHSHNSGIMRSMAHLSNDPVICFETIEGIKQPVGISDSKAYQIWDEENSYVNIQIENRVTNIGLYVLYLLCVDVCMCVCVCVFC